MTGTGTGTDWMMFWAAVGGIGTAISSVAIMLAWFSKASKKDAKIAIAIQNLNNDQTRLASDQASTSKSLAETTKSLERVTTMITVHEKRISEFERRQWEERGERGNGRRGG